MMPGMAVDVLRTPAEELADAEAAILRAQVEMRNWSAHCQRLLAAPEDAEAIGWQARRSAGIVGALLDEAHLYMMAARI